MCGRFTLTATPDELQRAFPWLILPEADEALPPRYNIAPSQPIPVVPNTGENRLDYFVWGLIPFWAKDPKIGNRLINARSETLAEKPSFKAAYKYRRCLVLADGFYEWEKETRRPHYARMKSGDPFAFAAIWERLQSPDGSEILSSAIITTAPNEVIAPVHNRMPVILSPQDYHRWLTPGEVAAGELDPLLKPHPSEGMEIYPVSTVVNNPRNDHAACIRPLEA